MFCLYEKPLLLKQYFLLFLLLTTFGRVDGNAQAVANNRDTTLIMSLINRGLQQSKQDKNAALALLHKGLAQSRVTHYTDGIAKALYGVGLTYNAWNEQEVAIRFNRQALVYAKRSVPYRHLVPAIYSNIGYSYYGMGDYRNAISYFDSSVKEGLRINLPKERRHLANTLNNLAVIHVQLDQSEKALPFLDQAEDISRKGNFPEQLAITLGNKASVYDQLGDTTRAEYYYNAAIQLGRQYDDMESLTNLAALKSGLAALKLKQNKAHEALELLNEIRRMDKSFKKEYFSIMPDYLKGKAWFQLADYTKATSFLLKAIDEANAINSKDNLVDMHKVLSQVYDSTGNYKKSAVPSQDV